MPAAKGHGSGSARVRRKRAHAGGHEEGGSERWLVTYADMLTLLLVLFIVLFSVSVVNTSKFISLKTSLASVFGDGTGGIMSGGTGLIDQTSSGKGEQQVNPGLPVAPGGRTQTGSAKDAELDRLVRKNAALQEKDSFTRTERRVSAALRKAGLAGTVRFAIDHRGLVITVVTDALVFPGNSADLLPKGEQILQIVAPSLRSDHRAIEVDGHTNQAKVSTHPYASGWELSSARASRVVRELISDGIGAHRLTAVGYSDQRPLYPARDPRSFTLNRRVEIVVLSTTQPTSDSASS